MIFVLFNKNLLLYVLSRLNLRGTATPAVKCSNSNAIRKKQYPTKG